jgi:enoyl-CoA hydratase
MGTKSEDKRPNQRIRLWKDRAKDTFLNLFLNPKITIAQAHGPCIGGGVYLLLTSDLAVVSDDCQLGFTEQRLGFSGSGIPVIPLLLYTVGLKKGLDILLTGRVFNGKEAEEMGLVNKSVPADKLDEEVNKLAKAMTLLPRDGIAVGKATRHLIYDSMGLTGGFTLGYSSHTLFTNLRWEADEYNFFRERRDKGTKTGFKARDERYSGLV